MERLGSLCWYISQPDIFFPFLIMPSSKAGIKPPLAMNKGRGGWKKETTKTAGPINTCVFFHCCMTEALGIWICDSAEESDPRKAMHSLCFLGF